MTNNDTTPNDEEWENEEEFLQWLDSFCDYVVGSYKDSTAKYPDGSDLHKAQKARGIQNDLKSGKISFEEALERYERELVVGEG